MVILEVNSEVGGLEVPIRQAKEEETAHEQGCTRLKYNLTAYCCEIVIQTQKGTLTLLFLRLHYSSLELYDLSNVEPLVSVAHKPHAVGVNSRREKRGPRILGLILVDLHLWHEKVNSLFRKLNYCSHLLYFLSYPG